MLDNFISVYKPSNLQAHFNVCVDDKASSTERNIAAATLIAKIALGIMLPITLVSLLESYKNSLIGHAIANIASLIALHEIVLIVDNVYKRVLTPEGQIRQNCSDLKNSTWDTLWYGPAEAEKMNKKAFLKALTANTLIVQYLVNQLPG